jgi:hypothetical protein
MRERKVKEHDTQAKDVREKPYALFRVKMDAGPILLRRED